jgi:hypothetical protein
MPSQSTGAKEQTTAQAIPALTNGQRGTRGVMKTKAKFPQQTAAKEQQYHWSTGAQEQTAALADTTTPPARTERVGSRTT